jgi:hypothetical protein
MAIIDCPQGIVLIAQDGVKDDAERRFGGKIAAMICRPSHRPAKPACTPAAGRGLSAGAKSLRKSDQWVCRLAARG